MTKEYKYKLQGDGRDSWEVSEFEGELLLTRYMVYENPELDSKINLQNIDISTLSIEQLKQLKTALDSI